MQLAQIGNVHSVQLTQFLARMAAEERLQQNNASGDSGGRGQRSTLGLRREGVKTPWMTKRLPNTSSPNR